MATAAQAPNDNGRTPILVLESCGSTNAEAMARAVAGERGPLWIMAREQTAGKGRSGRTWAAGVGNLTASVLTTIDCPPDVLGQLALVAGLALHDAVTALAPAGVIAGLRLKWPNDLMIGKAKCAGILVETTRARSGGQAVVIGFGVNVVSAPDGLDRPVAALASHGLAATADALLAELDSRLLVRLHQWQSGAGFAKIRVDWLAACGPLGQPVEVRTNTAPIRGVFAGICPLGGFLVTDEAGVTRAMTFGDVEMI